MTRRGRPRARNLLETRTCETCLQPYHPLKEKPFQKYCSRPCANAGTARRTAAARAERQRGRGDGKAYRKLNGRHMHRVIAEATIGRALLPKEVVHHINGNILDNRPENLAVLPSQGEHARIHARARRKEVAKQ